MELLGRLGLGLVLRVRVRVSINIKYILYFNHVLHFIHLHSVGGAKVWHNKLAILCILCPVRRTGPSTNHLIDLYFVDDAAVVSADP